MRSSGIKVASMLASTQAQIPKQTVPPESEILLRAQTSENFKKANAPP